MKVIKNTSKPDSQITIYETEDGKARISVRFEKENVWLTQKLMADLFECSADNISLHLKNAYASKELSEETTTEDFSVVQTEGNREVKRTAKFFNLEAIIAVGYRVNEKLDAFLKFNEQDILNNSGKVSHDVAIALAEKHYAEYRIDQDQKFVSDFDKEVKKLLTGKKSRKKDPE